MPAAGAALSAYSFEQKRVSRLAAGSGGFKVWFGLVWFGLV
jgi:hypothetical protein